MQRTLKPAEGFKVYDPVLKDYLPPEGRSVEMSLYWHRRVADGDVTDEEGQKETEAKAARIHAKEEQAAAERAEADAERVRTANH